MPEKFTTEINLEKKEAPKEIERKFLVTKLPKNLDQYQATEIAQAYTEITEERERRVRKKGHKFIETIKEGTGKSRNEFEKEVSEDEFNQAIVEAEKNGYSVISKTRYEIPREQGNPIELDVYHGDLEGKFSVEVEFDNEKQADEFEPPEWFGPEVTEDKAYKNKNLAKSGWPQEKE